MSFPALTPIPANSDGQYDVRQGIPPGCIHVPGKRLTLTCRALNIECAAAIIGEGRKKFGPKLDGVIIRAEDRERLEEGIKKRDAARPSDEQKAARKAKKQQSDTEAFICEVRIQFPNMPEEDVLACAKHATEIGSGRVGRSSMAKNIPQKAVVAFVRHQYTPYDALLEAGTSREDARAKILPLVQAKINEWCPDKGFKVRDGLLSRPKKR